VDVGGAPIQLPASAIQVLALALHELATNAVKYGALSQPSGHLQISWRQEASDAEGPRVVLDWEESGVVMPPRDGPPKRGYGRELIERALPYQLGAYTDFHFDADGVRCRIAVPIALDREGRKNNG
jgi:two-component sensor histidine kinase